MPIFFTSDHHFGDAAARTFYRRPFSSVEEMDQKMIACWNTIVGDEDEVWHLGDFAVRQPAKRVTCLLHALRGRKHLIVGNNDDAVITQCTEWSSVQLYAELAVAEILVVLCHYPFRTWRGMNKGAINLHGHSHGRLKPLLRQFDVGVDARDFTPITLQELLLDRGKAAR